MPRPFALILALIAALGTLATAQSSLMPPILLERPSDSSAPPASIYTLGGTGRLDAGAVTIDAQENIYVAGYGRATGVPGLENGMKARHDGVGDAFVAKLDRQGRPVWATYFGGNDNRATGRFPVGDTVRTIAVDAVGQVYIAGTTPSTNMPVLGGFQLFPQVSSGTDGFVAKLSADGRRLLYASYFGGPDGSSSLYGIAVGPAGEVWLAGESSARQLATTRDVSDGTGQVIVLRLNPAGSVVWSTRVGLIQLGGFAVDGAGQPYLAGTTSGGYGVLKLDFSGSALLYSTFIPISGGLPIRFGNLAVSPDGRALATGLTFDRGLPVRNAWTPHAASEWDGFALLLTAGGQVDVLTYLGTGESLAPIGSIDAQGNVAIAAQTQQANLLVRRALVDHHLDGPVYASHDRGTTWAVSGRADQPRVPATDLAIDAARGILYAAAQLLYRSTNRGETWEWDGLSSDPGIGFGYPQPFDRIAPDPRSPNIRYGAIAGSIYRHDAGAPRWEMIKPANPTYRTLAVSPHNGSVWTAGSSTGVEVSDDGGRSWTAKNEGLPSFTFSTFVTRAAPSAFAFHPTQPDTVFAILPEGQFVGMYVSTNNGASWQLATGSISPTPAVTSLAFDATSAGAMLAGTTTGLLRSTDGGRTWTRRLDGSRITAVATDPLKQHVAYAAGVDGNGRPTFYRSIDHGDAWHIASEGFTLRTAPTRLIVDPRDSLHLYVATSQFSYTPYVARLARAAPTAGFYAPAFASYLGGGWVHAMTTTAAGDLMLALTHPDESVITLQSQIVVLRIGR